MRSGHSRKTGDDSTLLGEIMKLKSDDVGGVLTVQQYVDVDPDTGHSHSLGSRVTP